MTSSFSYTAPKTIEEAILLLDREGFELFTGDQAYLRNAKKDAAGRKGVVSLRDIRGLDSVIFYDGCRLEIGAAVSFGAMLSDSAIQSVPVLKEALNAIKDPHLKNHSNAGGAIYHMSPAHGPLLAALLSLDAIINIAGANGSRQISLESYLADGHANGLARNEIVRSVSLTVEKNTTGSFHYIDYLKSGKIVSGVAITSKTADAYEPEVRLAVCGSTAAPVRLKHAEKILSLKHDDIQGALSSIDALEVANPFIQNPAYLRHLLKVLVKRAVKKN